MFYNEHHLSILVQPSSALDERLRSLRLVPAKQTVSVHGIGREVGRDVHPVIFHSLRERDEIIDRVHDTIAML